MSALIEAIRDVLDPEFSSSGPFRLTESDTGSTCLPVALSKTQKAVLLTPALVASKGESASRRLFPLFNVGTKGLAVMCDYILFCNESKTNRETVFVLLCELKSANVAGSRQQIENGALLANYIVEMAAYHKKIAKTEMPTVCQRGIVFRTEAKAPPLGDLRRHLCTYEDLREPRIPDLPFAYYPCGQDYPLTHFCV